MAEERKVKYVGLKEETSRGRVDNAAFLYNTGKNTLLFFTTISGKSIFQNSRMAIYGPYTYTQVYTRNDRMNLLSVHANSGFEIYDQPWEGSDWRNLRTYTCM